MKTHLTLLLPQKMTIKSDFSKIINLWKVFLLYGFYYDYNFYKSYPIYQIYEKNISIQLVSKQNSIDTFNFISKFFFEEETNRLVLTKNIIGQSSKDFLLAVIKVYEFS